MARRMLLAAYLAALAQGAWPWNDADPRDDNDCLAACGGKGGWCPGICAAGYACCKQPRYGEPTTDPEPCADAHFRQAAIHLPHHCAPVLYGFDSRTWYKTFENRAWDLPRAKLIHSSEHEFHGCYHTCEQMAEYKCTAMTSGIVWEPEDGGIPHVVCKLYALPIGEVGFESNGDPAGLVGRPDDLPEGWDFDVWAYYRLEGPHDSTFPPRKMMYELKLDLGKMGIDRGEVDASLVAQLSGDKRVLAGAAIAGSALLAAVALCVRGCWKRGAGEAAEGLL